jgi:exopolysaccharide production protein ExoZ
MSKSSTLPLQSSTLAVQKDKYETIQVLRFIAALMVIILHSTFYTSERLDSSTIVYDQGYNGVSLFFVISGFVMIISSEKLIENQRGWMIFAVKRIIRIVPIYWIITGYKILVLVFASSLVLHTRLDFGFILKSVFFIPAINREGMFRPFYGVGWTLNFEMFFYLLFTISLALKVRPIILLSIVLIPLSVLSFFKTPDWPVALRFYADPIILNFLYGMIIAKLILHGVKVPRKLAIPAILLGLTIMFFPTGIFSVISYLSYNPIATNIATFLVVYGGASIENYWGKKAPYLLVFLGTASYSLYLVHPSISPSAPTLLKMLHLHSVFMSVTLGVIGSILVGVVFYRFFEKPVTKFLTSLVQKSNFNIDSNPRRRYSE